MKGDILALIQGLNLKLSLYSKEKGDANYYGNCPFCKESSFNINPKRSIYKCFGCMKGGDVRSLIESLEE